MPKLESGEHYGFWGNRYIIREGTNVWLLRDPSFASQNQSSHLSIQTLDHLTSEFRNSHTREVTAANQVAEGKPFSGYQQNITGLTSFEEYLTKYWEDNVRCKKLMDRAVVALHNYANCFPKDALITLQSPESLAFDRSGNVVLLDAGFKKPPVNDHSYERWFPEKYASGIAKVGEATAAHKEALKNYFESFGFRLEPEPGGAPVSSSSTSTRTPVRTGVQGSTFQNRTASPTPEPRRSGTRWFLYLILLLLLGLVILLIFFMVGPFSGDSGDDPNEMDVAASSLLFGKYCVILPVQGTTEKNVRDRILKLFPDRVVSLGATSEERMKAAGKKLDEVSKSIDPDKLKKLFANLGKSANSVKFFGFSQDAQGVKRIIERGSIYYISDKSGDIQYGSLLQANSVKIIIYKTGLGSSENKAVLEQLRDATADFAAFKDALSILEKRNGYIVQVEPTPKAHAKLRKVLIDQKIALIFIPRPVSQLFDAVDPAAGSGRAFAEYALKIDSKCYWRLVSQDKRANVDYKENNTNDKMKWQMIPANQEIVWGPVPVSLTNGKTEKYSNFDIAVVIDPNKVVIFRNQDLFFNTESEAALRSAVRRYFEKYLKFNVASINDVLSIQTQPNPKDDSKITYIGTLLYTYLAEQNINHKDVQALTLKDFETIRAQEDNVLKASK